MRYAVTDTGIAPDADSDAWIADAANVTATNKGKYYVWYKAVGEDMEDSEVQKLRISIGYADITLTAPELTYTGEEQSLIGGDIPAGTQFILTRPDYDIEISIIDKLIDAVEAKRAEFDEGSDEYEDYAGAQEALEDYSGAVGNLQWNVDTTASEMLGYASSYGINYVP